MLNRDCSRTAGYAFGRSSNRGCAVSNRSDQTLWTDRRNIFVARRPRERLIGDGSPTCPRAGTTVESLAALAPAFEGIGGYVQKGDSLSFDQKARQVYPEIEGVNHVHHAGNSSGIVDGAAAVLLASPDYARSHGLRPRARVVSMATAGDEPVIMLTAPVPATRRCLEKAGMQISDIDLIEINEAFAAVPLKVIRDLEMDPETVNVNGGAIALGHPLGATGAMLIGTVLDELERRDQTTGLVTMCIGGGMGITTIVERI